MKKFKKVLSIALTALLIMQLGALCFGASAANADYKIVSPYEDVIWSGNNAWGAYKGTLHTHTTYSDADDTLPVMIKEYYNQDYDFVANADHGITGVEWNKEPDTQLLYTYQLLIDNPYEHLTDEEYEAITSGTYPLYDGTARNKKMVCVTGANEFNYISLTKNHVNGYFLPADKGNGFPGAENELGFEQAIKYIEENGGLSHINHPGDWLDSNSNPDIVNDPESIKFFGDLILKYDSCLGTEILNERNGTTGYDRILWDNLLMYTLPYGKNVIGFSNTDAHHTGTVDTSFSVFMMEENTVENIKKTMQSGALFAITRKLRPNDVIGPAEEIDVSNTDLPYPMFSSLTVDGHKITAEVTDADTIQWIANGKIISKSTVNDANPVITLDLDTISGAENFDYVRVEIFGEGGLCISQAMVIDDGSAHLTFEADEPTFFESIVNIFRGSKIFAIIVELYRLIKG
ncbi:MAG: hypothetical protein E7547_03505 [Ruminococcaceae bacterium]|nr:hypothetical protein [Oscillospiraceae bacterium]